MHQHHQQRRSIHRIVGPGNRSLHQLNAALHRLRQQFRQPQAMRQPITPTAKGCAQVGARFHRHEHRSLHVPATRQRRSEPVDPVRRLDDAGLFLRGNGGEMRHGPAQHFDQPRRLQLRRLTGKISQRLRFLQHQRGTGPVEQSRQQGGTAVPDMEDHPRRRGVRGRAVCQCLHPRCAPERLPPVEKGRRAQTLHAGVHPLHIPSQCVDPVREIDAGAHIAPSNSSSWKNSRATIQMNTLSTSSRQKAENRPSAYVPRNCL